ncbi:hypothetical protein D3C79_1002150 [compost metagenome]
MAPSETFSLAVRCNGVKSTAEVTTHEPSRLGAVSGGLCIDKNSGAGAHRIKGAFAIPVCTSPIMGIPRNADISQEIHEIQRFVTFRHGIT